MGRVEKGTSEEYHGWVTGWQPNIWPVQEIQSHSLLFPLLLVLKYRIFFTTTTGQGDGTLPFLLREWLLYPVLYVH